jgi:hypothetical protein
MRKEHPESARRILGAQSAAAEQWVYRLQFLTEKETSMKRLSLSLRWLLAAALVAGVAGCGEEKKSKDKGTTENQSSVKDPGKKQKQPNATE